MARSAPDTRRLYRHFLYLDGDEVLNALATIEGGEVDEVVQRILKEQTGNAALELPAWAAKLSFGGKKTKKVEEEVRLRRTAHSAVALLLKMVRRDSGLMTLGPSTTLADLEENVLLEFSADVHVPPCEALQPAESPPRPGYRWPWQSGPGEDYLRARRRWELARLAGIGERFVAVLHCWLDRDRVVEMLVVCEADYLLEDPRELDRRVTVVGQIFVSPRQDEQLEVAQLENGTDVAIRRIAHASSEAFDEKQTPGTVRLVRIAVRPLCIFK